MVYITKAHSYACRHNTSLKWTKEMECLVLSQWACLRHSRCPVLINLPLQSATLLHLTHRLKATLLHLTRLPVIPIIEKLSNRYLHIVCQSVVVRLLYCCQLSSSSVMGLLFASISTLLSFGIIWCVDFTFI